MPYMMQVKLKGELWVSVCPTDGKPYQYDTEQKAREMLEICYPDQIRQARLGGEGTVRVVAVE